MQPALVSAGVIAILVALAHSALGERFLFRAPEERFPPLGRAARASKGALRATWHLAAVAWVGMGAAFVGFASSPAPLDATGRLVVLILAAAFALTGAVVLVAGRGRHPAWAAFGAVGTLAAWAALA